MPILIVPISHLAKESRQLSREVILSEKPDYVALELDQKRFFSLFARRQRYDLRPSYSNVLGYLLFLLQKKLGASVGETPGEEFISAAKAASEVNAKVALVDQDIELTLRKFSRALSVQYAARFVALAIAGRRVSFDISKMPSDSIIEEAMGELKRHFPRLYEVFVEERNKLMAGRVRQLEGKVVLVVGAGHVAGLKQLLPGAKIVNHYIKTEKKVSPDARKKGKVRLLKNRG